MGAMKGFGAALAITAIALCAVPAMGSAAVLYDQTDSPSGTGIFSQNDGIENVQAADDFTVPPASSWGIESVDVVGLYGSGGGPITSANVTVYSNAAGLPGAELFARANVTPLNGTAGPNFTFPLSGASQLAPGIYWVSVQVNIPGGGTNIWDWATRTVQSGSPAAFRANSPLAICPAAQNAYVARTSCPGLGTAPDQLFRLNGTTLPTPVHRKKCKKNKKHHSAQSAKKKCKKKKRK
jgi:hypothetical protein